MRFLATLKMNGALTMLASPVTGRSLDRVRGHLRVLPWPFVAPSGPTPALSCAAAMGIAEAHRTFDRRADAALVDRLAREAAVDFDRQRLPITTYLPALVVRQVRDGLDGRATFHSVRT
jgi:hypothetical protein